MIRDFTNWICVPSTLVAYWPRLSTHHVQQPTIVQGRDRH